MKQRKSCAILLSFTLTVASLACPFGIERVQAADAATESSAQAEFVGLDAEYHTQEEIRDYYKSHPIKNMEAEFSEEPSVIPPYALGELTEETKQDALNLMNLYRYIAGVPLASITEEAQNYAQAAALACAINRKLDHVPARPEGMDKDLYEMATFGGFNCNLAAVGNKLCNSIDGYMTEYNGDSLYGHRRQLLDYYNTETGFGLATSVYGESYASAFVGASLEEDKIISYPGQNQPLEFFGTGYAWSVIIPEKVDESKVYVTITDTKTGNQWDFSRETENLVLDVGSNTTCALFSPQNIAYRDGDCYRVEITGISQPISYDVNMFLAGDPVPLESIKFDFSGTSLYPGGSAPMCNVKYTPQNATNKNVTWSSSDSDVAETKWLGTGLAGIIGKKPGDAVITATSEDGGYTAAIKVHVKQPVTEVLLSQSDIIIGVGQSVELISSTLPVNESDSSDTVHLKSDYDKNIISAEESIYVLNHITITGKAIGKTSFTAYASSNPNIQTVCNVNVVEPVYTEELRLDQTELEMLEGDTVQLNPSFSPVNVTCKELEWSSSDTSIVRVEDGKVTAMGYAFGEAVVMARAKDGSNQTAECRITVYDKHLRMSAPTVFRWTSDTVILQEVSGCEYSMDGINWQDSNVFTDLEPDQEYTFYIRKKAIEDLYVKAGDASEGTTVKTWPESSGTSSPTLPPASSGTPFSTLPPTSSGTSFPTLPPTSSGTSSPTPIPASTSGSMQDNGRKENVSSVTDAGGNKNKTGDEFAKGAYRYQITSSSTVKFVGLTNRAAKKPVIPSTVKNGNRVYKVTAIAANAFAGSKITHITIGANVSKIGAAAFKNCKKLKKITIQSTRLKSVGKNAFKGINAKAKIKVPAGKLKAYKKLLKGKGQGKKMRIY